MSSKSLVIAVFIVWSALCSYRYVCGIKQQCGDKRPAQAQQAIPFEPESLNNSSSNTYQDDSASNQPAFTPIEQEPAQAPSSSPITTTEPDINKVHVEELADRALIHFPYNSTRKEEDAAIDAYLSRLAQQLISGVGKVTLTGHTDNVGNHKTNQAFALRRAKNIRDILIIKGVAKSNIICKSYGETKPLGSNDHPKGRYQNRRVEIRINQ